MRLWLRNLWHSFREHSFVDSTDLGDGQLLVKCSCGGVMRCDRDELQNEWRVVANDATCVRALMFMRQTLRERQRAMPQARLV